MKSTVMPVKRPAPFQYRCKKLENLFIPRMGMRRAGSIYPSAAGLQQQSSSGYDGRYLPLKVPGEHASPSVIIDDKNDLGRTSYP